MEGGEQGGGGQGGGEAWWGGDGRGEAWWVRAW